MYTDLFAVRTDVIEMAKTVKSVSLHVQLHIGDLQL